MLEEARASPTAHPSPAPTPFPVSHLIKFWQRPCFPGTHGDLGRPGQACLGWQRNHWCAVSVHVCAGGEWHFASGDGVRGVGEMTSLMKICPLPPSLSAPDAVGPGQALPSAVSQAPCGFWPAPFRNPERQGTTLGQGVWLASLHFIEHCLLWAWGGRVEPAGLQWPGKAGSRSQPWSLSLPSKSTAELQPD